MGFSSLMLSSVLLMIAMGLNQAENEPRLYWDMVFPDTPMPSAVEKLLPQAVIMKPATSRNVADGRVNFGSKGARDNSAPNYNGKSIEGTESNHPPSISGFPFPYNKYDASKKSDASGNVVEEGVNSIEGTKSNHSPSISGFPFPYNKYGASKKPDASRNVVEDGVNSIEGTESNHPPSISGFPFPYNNYGASKKPDAYKNVVEDGVNSIEGTESNHPPSISGFPFPYNKYDASKNSDASRNVMEDGINSIKGTESNHPPSISGFPFPYNNYGASKKPDASRIVVEDGVNSIEGIESIHMPSISGFPFPYNKYGASKKPDISRNVVEDGVNSIEGTESNHPPSISGFPFPYNNYGASKKSDASRNVVEDGVNSIEGTEFNHPPSISGFPFPYKYGASKKPDASRNVVEDGVNSIEGIESIHPPSISGFPFPYNKYGASKKPDISRNVVEDGVNSIEGTESKYGANEKPNASRNVVNDGVNFDRRGVGANTDPNFDPSIALFFHREELYPGKRFGLLFVSVDGRSAKFIPRQEANTIPFSTSEFPSILSHYSISLGSDMATEMRDTLQLCEMPSVAGEVAQCATSLEAMVDFATTRLGTHDVVAMTMEGGDAYAAERRPYKVKAVRRVVEAGGKGAVSCHPKPYPYVVFFCHSVSTTEVYSVDLILEDDGATMVKVVAICHLDTSKWNPKHISFKALGVKPGKGAVCHFQPLDHIVWATK